MNAKVDAAEFRLDPLKWLLVAVLVLGGAFANAYYGSQVALLYRVLALVVVGAMAVFVVINTEKGSALVSLLKASQLEVRKVVWPSRQETVQTTLIVVAVIIVMAIILWLLDMGLGYIASLIIG